MEVKAILLKYEPDALVCCEDCNVYVPADESADGLCADCFADRLINRCGDHILRCFLIENRALLSRFITQNV